MPCGKYFHGEYIILQRLPRESIILDSAVWGSLGFYNLLFGGL